MQKEHCHSTSGSGEMMTAKRWILAKRCRTVTDRSPSTKIISASDEDNSGQQLYEDDTSKVLKHLKFNMRRVAKTETSLCFCLVYFRLLISYIVMIYYSFGFVIFFSCKLFNMLII